MRIQRSLITALLLATLAVPAYAAVFVNADINLGPPEPRVEYVPAPRPGYIWSPGYWQWDGYNRYWMDGYWIEQRPGYVWVPDRWDHYGNGWRFAKGHYYQGRPAPRPVVVNRYYYNDHDHHDNGNHYGRDKGRHDDDHRDNDRHDNDRGPNPANRGAGVSNFHGNDRSNGHGPHDR